MINTNYNQDEDIVYVERFDEIDLQELLTYIISLDQEYKDLGSLYILDDIRDSTSKYEAKDYPVIIGEIQKRIKKYNEVRCALVVDTPFETVLSILYEDISKSVDNYNYKTFSTIEAAKSWLKRRI